MLKRYREDYAVTPLIYSYKISANSKTSYLHVPSLVELCSRKIGLLIGPNSIKFVEYYNISALMMNRILRYIPYFSPPEYTALLNLYNSQQDISFGKQPYQQQHAWNIVTGLRVFPCESKDIYPCPKTRLFFTTRNNSITIHKNSDTTATPLRCIQHNLNVNIYDLFVERTSAIRYRLLTDLKSIYFGNNRTYRHSDNITHLKHFERFCLINTTHILNILTLAVFPIAQMDFYYCSSELDDSLIILGEIPYKGCCLYIISSVNGNCLCEIPLYSIIDYHVTFREWDIAYCYTFLCSNSNFIFISYAKNKIAIVNAKYHTKIAAFSIPNTAHIISYMTCTLTHLFIFSYLPDNISCIHIHVYYIPYGCIRISTFELSNFLLRTAIISDTSMSLLHTNGIWHSLIPII